MDRVTTPGGESRTFWARRLRQLALGESPAEDGAPSRRGCLRRGALAGLVTAPVAALAGVFGGRASAQRVIVPHVGPVTEFKSIKTHENDHAVGLLALLGTSARPKPTLANLLQA